MKPASEVIEARVERIGSDGDGVACWRGKRVYLPFTAPGDQVRAVLGGRSGDGHHARVIELVVPGNQRARPVCRHFAECGGCALQHLEPHAYHEAKLASLQAALARLRIDPQLIQPLRITAPARRRARLGMLRPRDPRQPGTIGFRERFSHHLVDLRECPVLEAPLLALARALRRIVARLLPPGGRAEAHLTRTDSGVDLLLTTVENPGLDAFEALAGLAAERDLARILWRMSGDEIPIVERRPVRMMRSGVAVPFPPGAFLQASEEAEKILVGEVVAAIGIHRPVIDLYAGLGTFGFALAGSGPVHMVEGDKGTLSALARAASNARAASIEHRDLARDPVASDALAKFTAAVFDPPRAGAFRQADALARSPLDTVVAVSCNPATFARDGARLIAGGYRLERLVPIDQFVWSPHLELVAVFRR
jgi:23S rRNA (uracil1939-C5)-methyltransferase